MAQDFFDKLHRLQRGLRPNTQRSYAISTRHSDDLWYGAGPGRTSSRMAKFPKGYLNGLRCRSEVPQAAADYWKATP